MVADTRKGVRFSTGIRGSAFCDSRHETGGTICYGHWVLHLMMITFETGLTVFYGHENLSASCDSRHETRSTICYGHGVLHLVIADTRREVRYVTGIGFCIL